MQVTWDRKNYMGHVGYAGNVIHANHESDVSQAMFNIVNYLSFCCIFEFLLYLYNSMHSFGSTVSGIQY